MGKKTKAFGDIGGCIIEIREEAVKGRGEDAAGSFLTENGAALAVFDGCGGSGSRKYKAFHGKTGAYVASRIANQGFFGWYEDRADDFLPLTERNTASMTASLKQEFQRLFADCLNYASGVEPDCGAAAGTMLKSFPTTLAAAVCGRDGGDLGAAFFWAGNSRGYVLRPDGLIQVSEDDVYGDCDAMASLRQDPPLSNCLFADGDYLIRGRLIEEPLPLIVITATDGCFDCFPSPMHFEYMLLRMMSESESYDDWRSAMIDLLRDRASDDFSMVLGCFGFESFDTMKRAFLNRRRLLWKEYIKPLLSQYRELIDPLWQQYKPGYYGRR